MEDRPPGKGRSLRWQEGYVQYAEPGTRVTGGIDIQHWRGRADGANISII